ncbi:MAG TPA: hypothetical protein VFK59_02190 [Actinomycetota bacterium]|nr:hypothetical protein [Actinomycetota bacterium]
MTNDLDRDLRETFHRHAQDMLGGDPTPGPNTFRRIRRRQTGTVLMAAVAASAIAFAGISGLDAIRASETPAAPVPAVTGPAVTGPAVTGPPPVLASAEPDAASVGTCSDGARSHLELTRVDSRIKVRFEVHRSPVGDSWLIRLRHHSPTIPFPPPWPNSSVFFRGTRVASDGGVLAVQGSLPERGALEGYAAYAVDQQTGQVCRASTWF